MTFSLSPGPVRDQHLLHCHHPPDLILHCGPAQLEAHKERLAAVSGVFADMIRDNVQAERDHNNNQADLLTSKDRLVVEGMEEEVLRAILDFVYTGTADLELHCVELLKAAELYEVRPPSQQIERKNSQRKTDSYFRL